jgi:two-component system, cell cycle response regulator
MIQVLVADDDEALRSVVAEVLRTDGYSVEVARDGDDAWRLFEQSYPELVFTDIRMPGRTGLELLAEVKRVSPLTHVVIMTSHASLETALGALKSGAYDYLIKPFDDLELISCSARRALANLRLMRERDFLVAQLKERNEELERLNSLFRELAVKDGLTGLYNHRYAQQLLHEEVERHALHERPLSVLFVDLDHFKLYNDRHGHQKGDELLKLLAACLRNKSRSSDAVTRWGGEEFVVIAPETDTAAAAVLANKMQQAVSELEIPERGSQPKGFVSISIGVATLGKHASGASGLITQADRALYKAKDAGRNTVCLAEGFLEDSAMAEFLATTVRGGIVRL